MAFFRLATEKDLDAIFDLIQTVGKSALTYTRIVVIKTIMLIY